MASTRKDLTTKKDTKKAETRRREVQKRDITMKTTRDTRTRRDMNHTTLTMKSTERKEESMVAVNMDLSTEVMEVAVMTIIIKNSIMNCFKEAFMCLILIQINFHDTLSMK